MKFWPFSKKEQKKQKRAYAGAAQNRLVSSWVAGSTSMQAEIRGSLVILRNRARQLGRDNDYVKSFLRAVQNNVVGKGIGFQSHINGPGNIPNVELNKLIETEWKRWCRKNSCDVAGRLNFSEIERLLIRNVAESGEMYVRIITKKFGKSKIPMGLQIIEGDQICELRNGKSINGNDIRMGVEVDEYGRTVAYHMYSHHPGDYQLQDNTQIIVVPAEDIIPLFISERTGQTRGVTWLASSIMRSHQMNGYEEATVIRARVAASIMGFIQNKEGEVKEDAVSGSDRLSEFEPGSFKYMGIGEEITIPEVSSPGGEYDPFMRSQLRGLSAGTGASYETISKDFSQSNFSSTRQALIEDRDNWKVIQDWMIKNFHQIVFEAWLDRAVLAGVIKIKGYETNPEPYQEVQWMPRGWQWIDPLKDVTASKEAIKAGLDSQSNVLAQSGLDFETVMLQRKREKEYAESLGLTFDVDEPQINASTNNPINQINSEPEDSTENENQDTNEVDS
ncbi:MAG: phage portal protein [Pseudobdellovibrionaceae bacterium]